MSGFKILNHMADIGIEVDGKTLNELFINSVKGLYFILVGDCRPKPICEKISQKISLVHSDYETLLVGWLNEILFNAMINKRYFDDIDINISETKLTAQLSGYTFDCYFRHEVKSATYHNLKIKKTTSGYKTKIIFDV